MQGSYGVLISVEGDRVGDPLGSLFLTRGFYLDHVGSSFLTRGLYRDHMGSLLKATRLHISSRAQGYC